jgi:hypothetical protein
MPLGFAVGNGCWRYPVAQLGLAGSVTFDSLPA